MPKIKVTVVVEFDPSIDPNIESHNDAAELFKNFTEFGLDSAGIGEYDLAVAVDDPEKVLPIA